ncbi:unnamed protein product [Arabis nemorensis]|uniref:Uncharacterized protein n=1 Tax=Arabis nemorensis TaxID=586526 RepID=A0A565BFV2_9BRAS|nr:unnamed protein product [Arabis nemorensis]
MTTSNAFRFVPPTTQRSACSSRRCASSPVSPNPLGPLCLADVRLSLPLVSPVENLGVSRSASSASPPRILKTTKMAMARPPPPPEPPDPLSAPSSLLPHVKLHHRR